MKKLLSILLSCVIAAETFSAEREFTGEELMSILDNAVQNGGKSVKLGGGVFRLSAPIVLTKKHSGLAIDGGGATITGAKIISGWKKSDTIAGAWVADLPSKELIPAIFVNGTRRSCTQYPKNGSLLAVKRVENGERHGARDACMAYKSDVERFMALSPAELDNAYIHTYRNWVQVNVGIKEFKNPTKKYVEIHFKSPLGGSMFTYCAYPSFQICNTKLSLTVGEFYFDRANSKIYYIPTSDEDMASAKVEYPFVQTPFTIAGKFLDNKGNIEKVSDITVRGVSFKGGAVGFYEGSPDAFMLDGQSAGTSISTVRVAFASNIAFEDCRIENTDSYALWIAEGVVGASVKNCILTDIGLGGIKIGIPSKAKRYARDTKAKVEDIQTRNIAVEDCLIYKYGRVSKSGAGILAFDVPECKLEHNEIFDGYYTGISYGWTWGFYETSTRDTSISFNKIHDLSFGVMNDLGGIYTLGASPNSKIEGNFIENIECFDYGAWGIYNDEGSQGWSVFNNYVNNSSKGGYFMHYGKNCRVYNNIIRNSKDYQFGLGQYKPDSYVFERNIIQYRAPAAILRKNQLLPPQFAKCDYNAYYCEGGVPMFAELDFKGWQATGQDPNGIVEKIDIDDLLKNNKGVEKIGFKPVNFDNVGTRGKMRQTAAAILKDYKYPEIRRNSFVLPDMGVNVKFKHDKIGNPPYSGTSLGGNHHNLTVMQEGKRRFVRATYVNESKKPYSYFANSFRLDAFDFVKLTLKLRIQGNPAFYLQFRCNAGSEPGDPTLSFGGGKCNGFTFPQNEWIKVECVLPTHVNPDKNMIVRFFDPNGNEFSSQKLPYTANVGKFYYLYFVFTQVKGGGFADIADIRVSGMKK